MLQLGAGIALTRKFSASKFLEDAKLGGATIFNLLSVGPFLLSRAASDADRDHCLRIGIAAPMPVDAEQFEDRFGVTLIGAYGISDYAGAFAVEPWESAKRRKSVGRAFRDIECRLVDDDDFEVEIGQVGELLLRHKIPWLAGMGYFEMPGETLYANRNNWFHTGDLFIRDNEDYYYFVDRKKDALRRRGENISSFELEMAVLTHEGIEEVAAYGVKSITGEDEVAISVVLGEGITMNEKDILLHCEEAMPKFMVPRYIEIVSSLPKTVTMKTKKEEIRRDANGRVQDLWDREREVVG